VEQIKLHVLQETKNFFSSQLHSVGGVEIIGQNSLRDQSLRILPYFPHPGTGKMVITFPDISPQ
jgi:hypothetical protein